MNFKEIKNRIREIESKVRVIESLHTEANLIQQSLDFLDRGITESSALNIGFGDTFYAIVVDSSNPSCATERAVIDSISNLLRLKLKFAENEIAKLNEEFKSLAAVIDSKELQK